VCCGISAWVKVTVFSPPVAPKANAGSLPLTPTKTLPSANADQVPPKKVAGLVSTAEM
jgi:hypothetical protein